VPIVRIHVGHLSNVPDLEASVIGDRVELVVFSVELDPSNGVSVPDKSLDLLLIVNVPDPHQSVLAPADEVLPVSRYAERLIEMSLNGSIVFFTFEYNFLLAL
jgi:hypothetical protein